MPDVLKCPKCDANADVTKDGKWAHCASCKSALSYSNPLFPSPQSTIPPNLPSAASFKPLSVAALEPSFHSCIHPNYLHVITTDGGNKGNNIFQPSESPDVKEGEKEESK
ncbi:hypothetical protein KCU86_g3040, partial [Aureobasidium melanogenum]